MSYYALSILLACSIFCSKPLITQEIEKPYAALLHRTKNMRMHQGKVIYGIQSIVTPIARNEEIK